MSKLENAVLVILLFIMPCKAQVYTAGDFFKANIKTDGTLVYDVMAEGESKPIVWGMDVAWDSETNVRRGVAYIGSDQIGLGRASFQSNYELTSEGELCQDQKKALESRLKHLEHIGKHIQIVLNSDPGDGSDVKTMYKNSAAMWAQLIYKTYLYTRAKGFNVCTVSPFNEPDFGWGQGSIDDFYAICKELRGGNYPLLDTVRISAGNTLNCDKASYWYNYMKPYVNEGNTHQLAGSFKNYADFFAEVRADGNCATADELHNVMEAMVGVEYGMQNGIWWGFDGLARGEFCRASFGDRLAYAEDRAHWTAASVYRNTLDDRIEAFIGTSERQANPSSYRFVSKDRDVYYDGYGPQREFVVQMPGGKTGSYQNGQTNAERVVMITWGEDVPPAPIDGTYVIMNKNSRYVMGIENGSSSDGTKIGQYSYGTGGKKYLQWNIVPCGPDTYGDLSYYKITSVANGLTPDVWNWSLDKWGDVKLFNGSFGDNELWWFEYVGDGDYIIHNKHSNLVLEVAGGSKANGANIYQDIRTGEDKQRWRLIPIDARCELNAPETPVGLEAQGLIAGIRLCWQANKETDLDGYTVLRADSEDMEWNTIGRRIKDTIFVDNTCVPGHTYLYKIKAIDYSVNSSESCEPVVAITSGEKGLVAQWQFDSDLSDTSGNLFDASCCDKPAYANAALATLHASGTTSINLDGTKYIQVPYAVAQMSEMTICGWFKMKEATPSARMRLFDFGSGEDDCMYLTPNNGSEMCLMLKKEGQEESITSKKLTGTNWRHIAVTFSAEKVSVWIDGEEVASSDEISLSPLDIAPVICNIGRSQSNADPFLKAYVDDVRIYNYSLSAAELSDVMNDTDVSEVKWETMGDNSLNESDGLLYDLMGRRISAVKKGIYIMCGKKYYVK
ncbi:MAG: RICIN domain-containing protein [Bacteroidaceae bacterium]|nr:RICIN domain-containing protein [Bacteroidaceae bacterium]